MSYDPHRTKDQQRQHELDEARAKLKAQQEVDDLRWLLEQKAGRRVVWRWLERSGVFRNPYHPSGSQVAFNCGEMNQGQRMLAEVMEHVPEAFILMMQEAKSQ